MESAWFAVASLAPLVLVVPAFAQDQPQDTVKTFTFKKTTHADKTTPVSLGIHVHFPPNWKAEDKRPAIIFWFGGGFTQGTVKTFVKRQLPFRFSDN